MLQLHVKLCCIETNVAHKVQRSIFSLELVSNVLGFIPEGTHVMKGGVPCPLIMITPR